MSNGTYEAGHRTVVKEGRRAYVVGGALVGGVAPMNLGVGNIVRSVGCSPAETIKIASWNPAAVIGVGVAWSSEKTLTWSLLTKKLRSI